MRISAHGPQGSPRWFANYYGRTYGVLPPRRGARFVSWISSLASRCHSRIRTAIPGLARLPRVGAAAPLITLSGETDVSTAAELSQLVTGQLADGTPHLTIDVSGLDADQLVTIREQAHATSEP